MGLAARLVGSSGVGGISGAGAGTGAACGTGASAAATGCASVSSAMGAGVSTTGSASCAVEVVVMKGMYSAAPALVAAVMSPAGTRPVRAITEFRRTLEFDAFL